MTARKILALACVIIALLVVRMTKQYLQIKDLRSQIADIELQQEIRWLINALRVPSEALYYDHKVLWQIAEIRQQAYERMQVEEVLPYTNVFGQSNAYQVPVSNVLGERPITMHGDSIYFPASEVRNVHHGSFEHFWMDRTYDAMRNLEFVLDNNVRLGKYYNEHPDEFDKVVKPWVLRMTRITQVSTSLTACEILLKRGYRDEEIIEAVRQVLENAPSKEVVFPDSLKEAMRLNDLYKLGIDVPADEPAKTEQGS